MKQSDASTVGTRSLLPSTSTSTSSSPTPSSLISQISQTLIDLLPPRLHPIRRRLRRPLHRPPHHYVRIRFPQYLHAHVPQGDQGLQNFQIHRGHFRQRSDLPDHRKFV
jgi:hypothetical protein